jgi:TP901 family phage tail tape measure protein
MAVNLPDVVQRIVTRLDTSGLDAATASISALGSVSTRVAKNMTLGLSVPIAAFGATATKTFVGFQAEMNRVNAVSGATENQFQALNDEARRLGATMPFTATQVAEGMSFLALAGFEANEILEATEQTLTLAAAGAIDLGRAADISTNILTAFSMETSELNMVVDSLAKTFTSSNTSLEQLGQAMKFVAPVANSAGLEFNEISAALGLLGNAGIQASLAGTTLRGVINRLSDPTAESAERLKELGINAIGADGNIRPLVEIIEEFENVGLTAADALSIFGLRAGPGMAALVAQGSDALRTFKTELDASGGTAAEIQAKQMEGLVGAFKELKSAFQEFQISIVDAIDGPLEGLVDVLTSIFRALAKFPGPIKTAGALVAVFAALAGPVILARKAILALGQSMATMRSIQAISLAMSGQQAKAISVETAATISQTAALERFTAAQVRANTVRAAQPGFGYGQVVGIPAAATTATTRAAQQSTVAMTAMTKATKAAQAAKLGLGAAMGALAGPWGAALTLGAVFVPMLMSMGDTTSNVEKEVKKLNDELEKTPDLFSRNSDALQRYILQQSLLAEGETLTRLTELGVSIFEVTDAMLLGDKAFDQWISDTLDLESQLVDLKSALAETANEEAAFALLSSQGITNKENQRKVLEAFRNDALETVEVLDILFDAGGGSILGLDLEQVFEDLKDVRDATNEVAESQLKAAVTGDELNRLLGTDLYRQAEQGLISFAEAQIRFNDVSDQANEFLQAIGVNAEEAAKAMDLLAKQDAREAFAEMSMFDAGLFDRVGAAMPDQLNRFVDATRLGAQQLEAFLLVAGITDKSLERMGVTVDDLVDELMEEEDQVAALIRVHEDFEDGVLRSTEAQTEAVRAAKEHRRAVIELRNAQVDGISSALDAEGATRRSVKAQRDFIAEMQKSERSGVDLSRVYNSMSDEGLELFDSLNSVVSAIESEADAAKTASERNKIFLGGLLNVAAGVPGLRNEIFELIAAQGGIHPEVETVLRNEGHREMINEYEEIHGQAEALDNTTATVEIETEVDTSAVEGSDRALLQRVQSLKPTIEEELDNAISAVEDSQSEFVTAFDAIGVASGQALPRGFANSDAKQSMVNQAIAILKAVKNALGISSPSRLFMEEVGEPIALGVARGIANEGGKISKELIKQVKAAADDVTRQINSVFSLISATRGVRDAERGVADSQRATADARRDLADAQRGIQEAQRGVAEATRDVSRAERAVTRAERDLAEATRGIAEAQRGVVEAERGVQNALRGIADAERAAVDARRGVEDARRGVIDAERGVQDARRGVIDAERDVIDAHRGVEDAVREIEDAERAVQDAERGVRDAIRGVEDANRALEDARRSRVRQVRDVGDAETNLNMLLEEAQNLPAAIANAEQKLAQARAEARQVTLEEQLAVAQSSERYGELFQQYQRGEASLLELQVAELRHARLLEEVTGATREEQDAERELMLLREREAAIARDIQDAEWDLEDARLAQEDAARDVVDAEEGILEAHRDVEDANRTLADSHRAVTDAERGLQDAHRAVEDAERGVLDAHRAVEDADRALVDSHRAVEDALRAVEDADRAVTEANWAHEESLRAVEDAERAVTEAIWAEEEAAWAVEEAVRGVDEAHRNVADAIRGVEDATRRFEDAERAVTEAIEREEDALINVIEAHRNLREAQLAMARSPEALDYFRDLALEAGLAADQIDRIFQNGGVFDVPDFGPDFFPKVLPGGGGGGGQPPSEPLPELPPAITFSTPDFQSPNQALTITDPSRVKPEDVFSIFGLATGGVVTSPIATLVGEGASNEAVIPLEDPRGISFLTRALIPALQAAKESSQSGATVNVEINNPRGETSGQSLSREMRILADEGMFGGGGV